MVIRLSLGLVVALGLALLAPADAQQPTADTKAAKGVKARNLVTSLGGFSATVNAPILVTGQTIELEPGGHTGRQQFRVPTFIYVVEGILTTEYETGPVGIAGAQYHAAGQSYMDNGGWWHNAFNRTDKPVKYLILHIGYPGRPDPIVKPDAD
jgi:hypothetical protein